MELQLLILILSIIGLLLVSYITYKKNKKQKLVCSIGKNCEKVLYSKYARTFSISNNTLGILYYTALIVLLLVIIFSPIALPAWIIIVRNIAIVAAAIFSIYLSYMQVVILRELCEYCLGINLINILLLICLFI